MKKYYLTTLLSMVAFASLHAQSTTSGFREVYAGQLPGVSQSSAAWGDYDADGDLDILLTGNSNGTNISKIYQNTETGFTEVFARQLLGVSLGSVAWGDYDADGDLDILLTGRFFSKIYQNTNIGFTEVFARQLPRIIGSNAVWGDYDADGDIDILLIGLNIRSTSISSIYQNTGMGFTEVFAGQLTGVSFGSAAWGDYDADGDLDILLLGQENIISRTFSSKIYENTETGFAEVFAGQLTGVSSGSAVWGDYDADGDLDILLNFKIYQNIGTGFIEVFIGELAQVSLSSSAWGDYDADGDLDILLTGRDNNFRAISKIYQNTGTEFTEVFAGQLTGVYDGSVAWGDYDTDGDLDILLSGRDNNFRVISKIYENNSTPPNTTPSIPTNPTQTVFGNTATLTWDAATDTQTPSNGLNYNISIGTTSGIQDIRSAHADLTTGYRRNVQQGNIQSNSWTIKNISPGTYFWSVQAIDANYAGGTFSTTQTFTIENISLIDLTRNLAYGEITVNTSLDKTMVITNRGTMGFNLTGITLPAGFTSDFSAATLVPGEIMPVIVTFSPTEIISYTGDLTITGNFVNGNNTLTLSGRGAVHPTRIIRLAGDMAFGNVIVNTTNNRILTIHNDGNNTLSIQNISITDANGVFTSNATSTITNQLINPSSTLPITVSFTPTEIQDYTGIITVNSNKTAGANAINLSGTSFVLPDIPQNIRVVTTTPSSVTFAWDVANNATGYRYELSDDSEFSNIVTQSDVGNVQQSISTGLTAITTYYIRVTAYNNGGNSNPSTTLIIVIPNNEATIPTALAATNIRSIEFTAHWTGSINVTNYRFDLATDNQFVNKISEFDNLNTGLNVNQIVTGLSANTIYYYRLRAENSTSISGNSNIIEVRTLNNETNITVFSFAEQTEIATIDTINFRVTIEVALGSSLTSLISTIEVSTGASINPSDGIIQDFTNPVIYTVSAEDGIIRQDWMVEVIQPDNIVPVITNIQSDSIYILGFGRSFVSANITDNTQLTTVNIYFKSITAPDFSSTILNSINETYSHILVDADFDSLGSTFYFEAIDAINNIARSDTLIISTLVPANSQSITGFTISTAQLDYSIISMPYTSVPVSTIFSVLLPADKTKWQLLHYNGATLEEYPDFNNFEPGKGYWFLTNTTTSVMLGAGNTVSANENNPFIINLKAGWNMIGNPYPITLNWTEVINHNKTRGLITTELDNRNGQLSIFQNRAYSTAVTLKKYQGAFVNASSAIPTLEIPISATGSELSQNPSNIFNQQANDWLFEIQAKNEVLKYNLAAVGMHQNATQSIDYLDWKKLPRLSQYLDITFNQVLSGSIVNISDAYKWHFIVNNNFNNKLITLTWNQDYFNQSAFGIILIDPVNQRKIDISTIGTYTFMPVSESHPFDLYYGRKEMLNSQINSTTNLVGTAYPNPFSESINFPISLENGYKINIQMVNLTGKVILKDNVQYSKSGYYEYTIDFNHLNTKITQGTYIIRIELETASETKIFHKKVIYKK